MEEIIDYMPKKNYKYVAILFFVIGLIPFILSIIFFVSKEMTGFWFMFISFSVFLLTANVLVSLSKLKIKFTTTSIFIQQDKQSKIMEYKYEDYLFAYYSKNYKGQMFLILSECALGKKRVKSIVSYGGGFGAAIYDSCLVIFIDEYNKQIDVVRKCILENIQNVYEAV